MKQENTKSLKNCQKGQGLVEYLVLVALIGVAAMITVTSLGTSIKANFASIAESMGATVRGKPKQPIISNSAWDKRDMTDFMEGSRKEKR